MDANYRGAWKSTKTRAWLWLSRSYRKLHWYVFSFKWTKVEKKARKFFSSCRKLLWRVTMIRAHTLWNLQRYIGREECFFIGKVRLFVHASLTEKTSWMARLALRGGRKNISTADGSKCSPDLILFAYLFDIIYRPWSNMVASSCCPIPFLFNFSAWNGNEYFSLNWNMQHLFVFPVQLSLKLSLTSELQTISIASNLNP